MKTEKTKKISMFKNIIPLVFIYFSLKNERTNCTRTPFYVEAIGITTQSPDPSSLVAPNVSHAIDSVLTVEEKTARFEAITAGMDKYRKLWNIPGIAFSVITTDPATQKRSVLFKGLGQADATNPNSKITENTVWQLASMSKLMTAYLAATVVDEGKLDWNKPLSQYTDVVFADDTLNKNANLLDSLCRSTGMSRTDYRFIG
jgi:CubicO group peptidase (beta-lactamase class C family)